MTASTPLQQTPVRIGAVNYLNTKPLVHRLEELAPWIQLSFDLPSRLADGLATGVYDVALIPTIEYFAEPAYTLVSNACIACRGPVLSVKLFGRVPPRQIRTVALDEGSRTSIALTKILLYEKYGIEPKPEILPIGKSLHDTRADAVLLIGDRAIHSPVERFNFVWDLGDEWVRHTGLPFVFAMWVARDLANLEVVASALNAARDSGADHLPEIAAAEAPALGLTVPECLAYLKHNLHYTRGPEEQAGLQEFRGLAEKIHLIPGGIRHGGVCNLHPA